MSGSSDLTLAVVKMVLSLALILALLWALQRWIARRQASSSGPEHRKLIRVVDSHYLGAKKSIAVVEVPGYLLIIGLGAEQVNLLARIKQSEGVSGIAATKSGSKPQGFLECFKELACRR